MSLPLGFGYIVNFNNGGTQINQYELNTYSTDGTLASKHTGAGDMVSLSYDYLKRLNLKTLSTGGTTDFTVTYAYTDWGTNNTTTLASGMRYKDASGNTLRKFGYYYDALGNITTVFDVNNAHEAEYTYDSQNQLATENLPLANIKYTYTYDTYGNIRGVTSQPSGGGTVTTNTYSYDDANWLDLLTAYNGQTITYDNIGNPINYYDGTSMTWQNGRQLQSLTKDGLTTGYVYNADGIRTQKTVNGDVHNYILDGARILADYSSGSEITFAYDQNNVPQSFTHNGTKYNYITDLQGDIIEIRDASNNVVGSYVYNAYGQIVSKSGAMADINPLRYRGYYYDVETGFYYLNSRYYDPEIGRFINADGYVSTGQDINGNNMFAYCGNNPVNRIDPTGHFWQELWEAFKQSLQLASGVFAAAGVITQLDSPIPGPADVVGGVLALGTILVCGGIAVYDAATSPKSNAKDEHKDITIAPATPNKKAPVIFPANPADFHPAGLTALSFPGTKNGAIIKWMSGKDTVFEWNENPNGPAGDGPHYHIRDLGDIHFYPGMAVPEPYATIYFGG